MASLIVAATTAVAGSEAVLVEASSSFAPATTFCFLALFANVIPACQNVPVRCCICSKLLLTTQAGDRTSSIRKYFIPFLRCTYSSLFLTFSCNLAFGMASSLPMAFIMPSTNLSTYCTQQCPVRSWPQ